MPAFLTIIILLIAALIVGSTIAFPVFLTLSYWFELDFESVTSRCVLIMAIILFLTFFKKLGVTSWYEIGFTSNTLKFSKELLNGLLLGLLIMTPVVTGLLLTHNRTMDLNWIWSINNIAVLFFTALLSGIVIALIEETLFRGVMLESILKQSSATFAIISTSTLYAFVHFLEPEFQQQPASINWLSSFELIKNAFNPWLKPAILMDSFIALFLAGTLLAILKIKTGSLAICIGVHAAWVLVIKFLKRVTHSNMSSEFAFLTGNYDKVIGYLAAVCLAVFIAYFLLKKSPLKNN